MAHTSSIPRVLMITQYLGIGGLERMILSLCRELKRRGAAEPAVFAYDMVEGGGYLCAEFAKHEIPVVLMNKSAGFSWQAVRRITAEARDRRIDLIHSHNLGALMYASLAKALRWGGARLVHTQHSFIHLKEKRRYAMYERIFCRFADALTVVSEDTRRTYLSLGLPARRIRLVENGVTFPQQAIVSEEARHKARQALIESCRDKAFAEPLARFSADHWILCLARLHPEKGQRHALRAWQALSPQTRKRVVLLFVGPDSAPDDTAQLRRECAALPDNSRILFTGGVSDPHAWINACNTYLSCSEFEGMPLGPLEAAGAGLPLILSRIPGHDFLNGYSRRFDLGDPAGATQAIEQVLESVAERGDAFYGELRARAVPLLKRYSIERMAEEYRGIYAEVLGGG